MGRLSSLLIGVISGASAAYYLSTCLLYTSDAADD